MAGWVYICQCKGEPTKETYISAHFSQSNDSKFLKSTDFIKQIGENREFRVPDWLSACESEWKFFGPRPVNADDYINGLYC